MKCEICNMDEGSIFLTVTQRTKVAKAHACMDCFEILKSLHADEVEELSQSEWNEVREREIPPEFMH